VSKSMLSLKYLTRLCCGRTCFQLGQSVSSFSTSRNHQTNDTTHFTRGSHSSTIGKWLLLVFPIGGVVLGTWQVQRKKWKLGLIKKLEERTTSNPQPFPDDLAKLKYLEYYPLVVKGKFDHSKEFLIQPRSLIEANSKPDIDAGSLFSVKKNNVGAQVITPFHLDGSTLVILINRGYVPRERRDPQTRLEGQIEQSVEVTGLLRHTEKRPPLSPRNIPGKNHWVYKDLDEMAAASGASPILLDALYDSNALPFAPIGGQTRVTLRDEHLSYIVTWYGLAVVTGIVWYRHFIMR